MFAVPQAPLTPPAAPVKPEPNPVPPASSAPSTDELKLQAARLQVQLSSLLFTETKNPAPAPPPSFTPPVTLPPALPVADAVKKVLQTTLEEAKPLVKSEPKLVPFPERKPASLPPADTGEVRVPSWLAPVSRNAEPAEAEPAASSGIASEPASSAQLSSEESQEQHSDAALFDGQPLSDTSAPAEEVAETGSKKSLFLGLAAAILLFLGGGAWHFRQNLFGTAATPPVAPAKTSSSVVSAPPLSDSPATAGVSTPTTTSGNAASPASPPVVSQASKSSSPLPTKAVFTPVPDPKVSESAPRSVARVEPPKKPAVGGIKLAKPVINRGSVSQQAGEALPALDMSSAMTDSLAAVNVGRGKEPVAPLPVGGDVKPARLIKSVPPVYPTIAKTQRVSGDVQLDALIDVTGNVASVKVISGPTLLHRAALDAVKQWKYTPALLNDQPTAMHLTVTVQFRTQ
jgi:TonB family protein